MSYKRESLLTVETEKQLINYMHPLWHKGYSSKEIAQTLHFGDETITVEGETIKNPYAQIKPEYVRYYRQKFERLHQENPAEYPLSFPPRKEPSFAQGEPRYNFSPEELMRNYGLISPTEFVDTLNEKLPYDSEYCRRVRSFLIVLYWTPLRSSEIYERLGKDFEITKKKIIIHLLRKKKKRDPKKKSKDEPVFIQREFPLVEEVIDYLESDEWVNEIEKELFTEKQPEQIEKELKYKQRKKSDYCRPWRITGQTARSYVKEVFGESFYPHFFRFRFLTEGASDPQTSLDELFAKSKLTLSALESYIKPDDKMQDNFDRRKIKRMKKEGVIK